LRGTFNFKRKKKKSKKRKKVPCPPPYPFELGLNNKKFQRKTKQQSLYNKIMKFLIYKIKILVDRKGSKKGARVGWVVTKDIMPGFRAHFSIKKIEFWLRVTEN